MATIQELTAKLNHALKLQAQIETLQQKLDAILGGAAPAAKAKKKLGKRTMSPATIAKMRAAQQARWAHLKASPATKTESAKAAPIKMAAGKKGGMSPEQKAKIAAAMKARWEAKKKDGQK